jgi:predicted small secreted protein
MKPSMKHTKRTTTLLALIAASLLMTACNTVKGLGRDIESVGRSGEEAIN